MHTLPKQRKLADSADKDRWWGGRAAPRGPALGLGPGAAPLAVGSGLRLLGAGAPLHLSSAGSYRGVLCWLFKGGFKVSSGTLGWYRSSYGTDFDDSEIAGPVMPCTFLLAVLGYSVLGLSMDNQNVEYLKQVLWCDPTGTPERHQPSGPWVDRPSGQQQHLHSLYLIAAQAIQTKSTSMPPTSEGWKVAKDPFKKVPILRP